MLSVTVTNSDLEHAVIEDCDKCLLAQALRRTYNLRVWVDADVVEVGERRYEHSPDSKLLMQMFDNHGSLALPQTLQLGPEI